MPTKKSSAESKTAKPTPKAKPAAKSKTAPPKKASATKGGEVYTKPELRERLKEKVKAGDKGGQPGQWSARKAQLLASEYKKEGGDYKKDAPNESQEHLKTWTEEKWQTKDGKKAQQGETTSRYLPKKAWDKLSPAEKKATDEKKKTASRTGKQFVGNTPAAKKARANAQSPKS